MGTIASGKFSIACCSRCHQKVPYTQLRMDGNIPGLWVCQDEGCYDNLNPFKKPARKADAVALDHPRPDVNLSIAPELATPDGEYNIFDQDGNWLIP